MELTRRGLITGLASFLAAPAIVRASSIMPVKALPIEWVDGEVSLLAQYRQDYAAAFQQNYALLQSVREDVLIVTGIPEREFFRSVSDISPA